MDSPSPEMWWVAMNKSSGSSSPAWPRFEKAQVAVYSWYICCTLVPPTPTDLVTLFPWGGWVGGGLSHRGWKPRRPMESKQNMSWFRIALSFYWYTHHATAPSPPPLVISTQSHEWSGGYSVHVSIQMIDATCNSQITGRSSLLAILLVSKQMTM